jgi:hypothetical protein
MSGKIITSVVIPTFDSKRTVRHRRRMCACARVQSLTGLFRRPLARLELDIVPNENSRKIASLERQWPRCPKSWMNLVEVLDMIARKTGSAPARVGA